MATGSAGRASMDQLVMHEKQEAEVTRGGSLSLFLYLMQQNQHLVENRTCRDVI
jgi:hypothetical protein